MTSRPTTVEHQIEAFKMEEKRCADYLRTCGYTVIAPPRTITVNGIEVPEPLREAPEINTRYYIPSPNNPFDTWESRIWKGGVTDMQLLRNGLIHLTKEAARAHFTAMIKPSTREVE